MPDKPGMNGFKLCGVILEHLLDEGSADCPVGCQTYDRYGDGTVEDGALEILGFCDAGHDVEGVHVGA